MTAITKLREVGLLGAGRGGVAVLRNRRLQRRFGFDAWHVGAVYSLKPYKAKVLSAIERHHPLVAVEIGCGLGDLIGRVSAPTAIGMDQEAAVIEGARVLHPQCDFLAGSLTEAPRLLADRVDRIDTLVLVNWPHLLAAEEVVASVCRLAAAIPVRRVLIDAIHPGVAGYAHHHTAAQLAGIGELRRVVPNIDAVRDLLEFGTDGGS